MSAKRAAAFGLFILVVFYFRACLNACGWFVPVSTSGVDRAWDSLQQMVRGVDGVIAGSHQEWSAYLVMCAAFGLVVLAAHRYPPQRFTLFAIVTVMAGLILVMTLRFYSTDVNDYLIRGRLLVVHHVNPFIVSPDAFPNDPYFPLISWPKAVWVYGPVWLLVVSLFAALPVSALTAVMMLRVLLLGAHLASGWLLWQIQEDAPAATRARQTAFYLFCPLTLWDSAINAHCDMLMVTFLLAGVLYARRRRPRAAVLWLAMAAMVKAYAAPAIFFFTVAEMSRVEKTLRLRAAFNIVAPAAALGFVLYAPFLHTAAALFAPFRGAAANQLAQSWATTKLARAWITRSQAVAMTRLSLLAAVGYGTAISAKSGRWVPASAWFFLIFCSFTTWFQPWYAVMALAFTVLADTPALRLAGLTLALLAPAVYLGGCMSWTSTGVDRVFLDTQLLPLDAAVFGWVWERERRARRSSG